MSDDETLSTLILLAAGGRMGPRRRLLTQFASAQAALAAGPAVWQAAGCTPEQCHALAHPDQATLHRSRIWLDTPNHHLLNLRHADFPPLLAASPWPPLALFVAGDPTYLWQPAIAIVGTRRPSAGGIDTTRQFASTLGRGGLVIASGLAAGVDAVAHRTALESGQPTIAVIGTGADIAYPRHHVALQAQIAERGAVVTEYLPGTTARAGQFPARNRLLAGLTLATVVVEAAERSGALITARLAAEAGREVGAVPGSIHNPMARGCHRLIQQGAALVQEPCDILDQLTAVAGELATALRKRLGSPIQEGRPASSPAVAPPDADYQCLWNALGFDPTGMDSLITRTGLTAATLSSMLLVMELEGRVTVEHGRYCRTTGSLTSHSVDDAGRGQ